MQKDLNNWFSKIAGTPRSLWQGIVLGNEACDLDSVASAIGYAYYLQDQGLYVPVFNCTKGDFLHKKEICYLLEKQRIDFNSLQFKEQLHGISIPVILVDHHEVALDQEFLRPYVSEIIDHHLGNPGQFPQLKKTEILPVGSTASLIAEKWGERRCPEEIALWLLSAILVDTQNLSDPIKTTALDRRMVDTLKYDAESLYTILNELKGEGSPDVLLRKDIKCYREGAFLYAIASLPKRIEIPEEELRLLTIEKGVHALFLWFAEDQSKILKLVCENRELKEAIEEYLTFPKRERKSETVEFICPASLSRKTLQPQLKFLDSIKIQRL